MGSLRDSFVSIGGAAEWGALDNAPRFDRGSRHSVRGGNDLDRILALPRRSPTDLKGTPRAHALIEMMTDRLIRPRQSQCSCASMGERCITRLRGAQAWSLFELSQVQGLLGYIGVGHGKTLLDICAALLMPSCRLAVLLVPSGLREQLLKEYLLLREHFHVPSIRIGDLGGHIVPGTPSLHVIPYSIFSRAESTDLLERLAPDLIIADEVHNLRHKDTARTGRLLRYFANHPETRFCGWSGSILASSIKDKAHLSALALRHGSPLPLSPSTVEEWALAVDPSDWPTPPGALRIFMNDGRTLQEGIHLRIVQTKGIVATTTSAIDSPLFISERRIAEVPAIIRQKLEKLRASWERPDGELILDALQMNRCAWELASGFFYRWKFPRGEPKELIDQWKRCRKAWHSEVRDRLKARTPHMDSPELCENAAIRAHSPVKYEGDLPVWHADNWEAWAEISEQVKPERDTVWVDDYLVRDAVAWGHQTRGIIWYQSTAFGARVADMGGFTLHRGGPQAEARILAEDGRRTIVASIKSHGTGRNGLQKIYDRQLVANPPARGDLWEQLMGRLRREGFTGQNIVTWCYRHTQEYAESIDRAIKQSRWVHTMMDSAQQLLSATLDFDPEEISRDLP